MKSILTLILILLIVSCSGTKKIIENQHKPEEETVKIPQIPELPKPSILIEETNEDIINEPKVIEEGIINDQETTLEYFDHSLWKVMLNHYVDTNGRVDYNGLKNERSKLEAYVETLKASMPTDEWPKADKLAYWINAYNALTVDLILRNYPLKSIKDIKEPWDQRLWKFGDKWLNLNDIEHNILRKMNEPRIHFAIVCASESCPKLNNMPFYASSLDGDLTQATKAFLSDNSKNEISENTIKLSKIFKWFAKDFKTNGSLIDFLNQYTDINISKHAKKSFKDYNWDLNE